MKKITHISLILLLTGLPSLLAHSFVETECCHSPVPVEQESHSCCEMEKSEQKPEQECDFIEMATSSVDDCGCIHQFTTTDETVITNTKVDLTADVILKSVSNENHDPKSGYSLNYSNNFHKIASVPIYITVSSYLN